MTQLDAYICRKDWSVEMGLGRWIQFDYIGSPFPPRWFMGSSFAGLGGNGGFSFRDKNKSLQAIQQYPCSLSESFGEDVFFSKYISKVGGRPGSIPLAFSFSIARHPSPLPAHPAARLTPWGVHKIWASQPNWEAEMVPVCPGLDTLYSLQKIL